MHDTPNFEEGSLLFALGMGLRHPQVGEDGGRVNSLLMIDRAPLV